MTYLGELISIGVAFSWTATALLSEFGSKRLGNLTLNVLRMTLALVVLAGVVSSGDGQSVTHRCFDRGCRMDAAIWTGGLCHW